MDGGSESAGACHAQRGKNWWPAVAKNMLKKSRVEASWYATSASRASYGMSLRRESLMSGISDISPILRTLCRRGK